MNHLLITVSVVILLFCLVSEVSTCTDPPTCKRKSDKCSEVQKYVKCLKKQSKGCRKSSKKRTDASISIVRKTYSRHPFNCKFSKAPASFTPTVAMLVITSTVVSMFNRVFQLI